MHRTLHLTIEKERKARRDKEMIEKYLLGGHGNGGARRGGEVNNLPNNMRIIKEGESY